MTRNYTKVLMEKPVAVLKRALGSDAAIRARIARLKMDEAGEGFIDVLVKMLIVVVVGAVLLTIMRQAVPQLFTDMLTKIRGIFDV